jgi:CD109 antigen
MFISFKNSQMPSGCTEQTFKSFIPNIVAINYMKAIGKLTDSFRQNGERYLTHGYQQLLGRRQGDGSFSMWGEAGAASIWLTAYVAKLLAHTKLLIAINDKNIVDALNFCRSKQLPDGNFPQGTHNYYYMKTKSQADVPLTAFVAIAFLENTDYREQYKDVVDKALGYINSKVAKMSDNFAIAIASYAFALNNHKETSNLLLELMGNAITENDKTHWNREAKQLSTSESPSVNVEIASYAIMALVTAKRSLEAIPIMKWLITQRSSTGGFYSTTDTVVGLQALAMIATELRTENTNMVINLSYEQNRKKTFTITPQDALVRKHEKMEKDTRRISLQASGSGLAFFQVAYRYNARTLESNRRFELIPEVIPNGNSNILHLKICVKFIPDEASRQSNMALVEVYLPSGYVNDPETASLVKKVGVRVNWKFVN